MFQFQDQSQLCFQQFRRFQIGWTRIKDEAATSLEDLILAFGLAQYRDALMIFIPASLVDLCHVQSFLASLPEPDESSTQVVFTTFLKSFRPKFSRSSCGFSPSVASVADMDHIDIPGEICSNYMLLNTRKRNTKKQMTAPKKVTLQIKSDVAIIEG